ncbi:MAG TPA: acetate/propionate family kinase [Anaerolineaceae bacterium]|nr:acetate/propionate family kinase [Anaerolineaceae bacterium]
MNILIINCGSSSLAFKVFRVEKGEEAELILNGKARNVATRTQAQPEITWTFNKGQFTRKCSLPTHREAAEEMWTVLRECGVGIDAVGHRFVHGGNIFHETTLIDKRSLEGLKKVLPLAPIHNPNSFSVIEVCLTHLPGKAEFVVFDTAFHANMPVEAREYALPHDLAARYDLRKYGFHGLSYQYVSARAAALLDKPLDQVKLILCHLGTGGSSVCAFMNGRSIDSSMGYSPLAGLVMSTRCGDIDAEVALELMRQGMTVDEVDHLLNNQSGLIGLSGYSSNLDEIITAAEAGNEACHIAYEVYAHRLRHYLGAYTWLLNGADAIVFTDDIGVTSWKLREKVCSGVERLGILIDTQTNQHLPINQPAFFHKKGSQTKLLVHPTDEERVILEEVMKEL